MDVVNLPSFSYKGTDFQRTFVDFGTRNELGHNLTELCAAMDVYNHNPDENDVQGSVGFVNHPDWIAHINKYAYSAKVLTKIKPSCWLDVGCGDLQLPWFLNKNRFKPDALTRYFGIDLRATEKWLTAQGATGPKHRYKANITLVKGDIVQDDFTQVPDWPAGGFEVVVTLECFEHVPRRFGREFMQRLFNWTAPGGTCLFATPNAGVSVSTAENHVDEATGESREWTYADKLALAREVGFEVVKSFGTFTGFSYLPLEVQQHLKASPEWVTLKEWLNAANYNCAIAAHYPEHSVASLQVLRRPAS